MSLSQLPAELIAHIASFLKFPQILEFRQTDRRTYQIMKRFKMDRPNFAEFELNKSYNSHYSINVKINSGENAVQIASLNEKNEVVTRFQMELEKCGTINFLRIARTTVSEDVADILLKNADKINNLLFEYATIQCSSDKLIKIGRKFKNILMKEVNMEEQHLTDQVFAGILPNTKIIRAQKIYVVDTLLTDEILNSMVFGDKFQAKMVLKNYRTGVTVKGIKDLLKKVVKENRTGVIWHFGSLSWEQEYDAQFLMEEINSDPDHRFVMDRILQHNGFVYELHERVISEDENSDDEVFDIYNREYTDFSMIFFVVEF